MVGARSREGDDAVGDGGFSCVVTIALGKLKTTSQKFFPDRTPVQGSVLVASLWP